MTPRLSAMTPDRERRMRETFDDNAKPLLRFLLRLTHGQRETAEDLLQETMLRAWRKVDELPDNPLSVRRWLFIVARHLTIDAVRARLSRPTEISGESVAWVPTVDDEVDVLLERHALRHALLQLSPAHRVVLVEIYYRGASVAEVASRIGVPEGTVRSRSFYALRTIRDVLSRAGEPVAAA
ncbi:sigma-70 family RNA polymerase sigma factor [Dactylosporangium sp. CA-092794]|uniref:sigma-70 family RNA polymerase sigma factor n=1 Tax=Dactylosporangium sp. CA-092794 TaxID=3239929 RepID=UPI003D94B35C